MNITKFFLTGKNRSIDYVKHNCLYKPSIIAYKEGNYPMAIEYAQKPLLYTVSPYNFYVTNNNIYNFCKEMGNYKMACDYADSVTLYIEKIYDESKAKSLEEAQTKYETEKTKLLLEKKNWKIKRNNNLFILPLPESSDCFSYLVLSTKVTWTKKRSI